MNQNEKDRVDCITRAIHQLVNGLRYEDIPIEGQETDEIRQLGEYVNRLAAELKSASGFAHDLSRGLLSTEFRSKLEIYGHLKQLQAGLRHLTWQTGQVAKGDFSQQVNFMGEFSTSFNWMVHQLAANQAELEKEISERKEAQRVAEESSRAKSTFLANMSHEIRTPMNGVLGMAELLLHSGLNENQRDMVKTLLQSGNTLLALLSDILDLSRIEAGKLEFQDLDFSLHDNIEEAVELFALQAHRKGLELICRIDGDVPDQVTGDSSRLRQILNNLISNAIKFTETGEIRVGVSLLKQSEDHALVCIEVQDTGVGIPPGGLAKIFDVFYQLDGSASRKYQGTGLGLSICRQLCIMMGGDIDVDSEPGAGSVFRCTLRFRRKPALRADASLDHSTLKGLRVLIVDDNENSRAALNYHITTWGMCNQEAASSAEALEMLAGTADNRAPFHLALIDESMPGMSGSKLAQRIMSDSSISRMPLILLANRDSPINGDLNCEAGVVSRISKPVRRSQLLRAILSALEPREKTPPPQPDMAPRVDKAPLEPRVLVAEDNIVNQIVLVEMLRSLGIGADLASDGVEAVRAVYERSYDLILMDWQMPEMDGCEATKRIRALERQRSGGIQGKPPHIPIVAITGDAMVGDSEKCFAAGMDGYLSKPVKMQQLETVLRRWIPLI